MQSEIATIPNTSVVDLVWFEPKYSAICRVGQRPFHGTVRIEYRPVNELIEFVSVERFIHDLASKHIVIEDVARLIFDEITRALGDIPLRIIVTGRTTVHAPAGASIQRGEWK